MEFFSGGFSCDNPQVPELLVKLCDVYAEKDPSLATSLYKLAFHFLELASTSNLVNNTSSDEQFIVANIRQFLLAQSQAKVEAFDMFYSNICKSDVLQNRCAALTLLYNLATNPKHDNGGGQWSLMHQLERLPNTPFQSKSQLSLRTVASQESIKNIFQCSASKKSSLTSTKNQPSRATTTVPSTIWSQNELPTSRKISSRDIGFVTEDDLLQDVIYSLQGIEGKYLQKEPGSLGFAIDPKVGKHLSPIQRGLVDRFSGMSFLHNQLKLYCEDNDKQSGIISQALIATLRDELSDYYKTIALLQAGMKRPILGQSDMTLRRALFVIYNPQKRFEWLAYIAEQCNDKKGGALITAIHSFLHHGSKCAQEISEKVLTAVCKPLYIILSRWLLDGEINDPCNEFFIEARSINKAERLWHDKYHVRESMVPSFITMEQARKILATGKSINFLRQICRDGGQLPGRDSLQKLFRTMSAEALFAPERSVEFHSTLENVYRETSLRVLDLLKNKFRLLEHLQSLRRYLLLGQGDFIRHLMELLAPELNKPAQDIYCHTLSSILESAIRVTNAQFEDEDTLKRLTVSFMGHSNGDNGWDVFSLVYNVDGPVGTIFQPNMTTYQLLFGALWKAKRMEFILANMRKQQITMSKIFRNLKELKPVMHIIHILTSEMIHFLHQTQYYFLFEVLECSWAEMQRQVDRAECLDDIISAHNSFLDSVKCGVLHDESSKLIFGTLRTIYFLILKLEGSQNALYSSALDESKARSDRCEKPDGSSSGSRCREEIKSNERLAVFGKHTAFVRKEVQSDRLFYKKLLVEFLNMLASSSDLKLQLLSVRLNFNKSYETT